MLEYFLRKFKKIDLYGRDLMFEEHNVQAFKTYIGAVLTLITFITLTIIGFLFGREIYQRKIPIVTVSNEILNESLVPLSDFPIVMYFARKNGRNIENIDNYIEVSVNYFKISPEKFINSTVYAGVLPCDPNSFTKHRDYISNLLEQAKVGDLQPYCINFDKNYTLKNPYAVANSASMGVSISECNISKNPKCLPDAKNTTKNMIATVFFMNSFINPKNYSNPVNYYEDSIVKNVGNGITISNYLKLSYDKLQSDNGWILEETFETEIITLQSIRESPALKETSLLISFVFEASKQRKFTTRNYLKVQDLLAKLGGLFNACSLVFQVLIYDYIRFKYRAFYSKNIINFEENKNSTEDVFNKLVKTGVFTKVSRTFEDYDKDCYEDDIRLKNSELRKNSFKNSKMATNNRLSTSNKNGRIGIGSAKDNFDYENMRNQNVTIQCKDSINIENIVNNNTISEEQEIKKTGESSKYNILERPNTDNLNNINKVQKQINLIPVVNVNSNSNSNSNKQNIKSEVKYSKNPINNYIKDSKFTNHEKMTEKQESQHELNYKREFLIGLEELKYRTYFISKYFKCCFKKENINKYTTFLTNKDIKKKYSLTYYLELVNKIESLESKGLFGGSYK